jgi:hypothetical protein
VLTVLSAMFPLAEFFVEALWRDLRGKGTGGKWEGGIWNGYGQLSLKA